MVQLGPHRLEMMEIEVPALEAGEALLRVEACGLCGSDIEQFNGTLGYLTPESFPMIPGHEPVGIIEEIDPATARAWGVAAGDRVAVVPHLACNERRAPAMAIFERAIARGEIRADADPGMLIDLISGFFWHRKLIRRAATPYSGAERFVDALLSGIALSSPPQGAARVRRATS